MGDHKSRKGADILGRESMDAGNDRKVGTGDDVRERPVRWAGPVGLGHLCWVYTLLTAEEAHLHLFKQAKSL